MIDGGAYLKEERVCDFRICSENPACSLFLWGGSQRFVLFHLENKQERFWILVCKCVTIISEWKYSNKQYLHQTQVCSGLWNQGCLQMQSLSILTSPCFRRKRIRALVMWTHKTRLNDNKLYAPKTKQTNWSYNIRSYEWLHGRTSVVLLSVTCWAQTTRSCWK